MPRVDFYLIKTSAKHARLLFACRLIYKAFQHGHQLFVHTESQQLAKQMDDLLWTFDDISFLPHNLYGGDLTPPPPIQIGDGRLANEHHDILINLTLNLPDFFQQYQRVIEIIAHDEQSRSHGRQLYRHYRDNQCEMHSHNLTQH